MPVRTAYEFFIESLAAPFERWRLLLLCMGPALLSSIILLGVHLGWFYLASESMDWFFLRIRYLSEKPHIFIGAAIFQWCWTMALLHESRRHLFSFMFYRNFWQSFSISLLIALWLILLWFAARILFALLVPVISLLPKSIMWLGYYGLSWALLLLIAWLGVWVTIRLMLWVTFAAAEKRWLGFRAVATQARAFSGLIVRGSFAIALIVLAGELAGSLAYQALYGGVLLINGVAAGGGAFISVGALGLIVFLIKLSVGSLLFAAICSGLLKIYRSATASSANAII